MEQDLSKVVIKNDILALLQKNASLLHEEFQSENILSSYDRECILEAVAILRSNSRVSFRTMQSDRVRCQLLEVLLKFKHADTELLPTFVEQDKQVIDLSAPNPDLRLRNFVARCEQTHEEVVQWKIIDNLMRMLTLTADLLPLPHLRPPALTAAERCKFLNMRTMTKRNRAEQKLLKKVIACLYEDVQALQLLYKVPGDAILKPTKVGVWTPQASVSTATVPTAPVFTVSRGHEALQGLRWPVFVDQTVNEPALAKFEATTAKPDEPTHIEPGLSNYNKADNPKVLVLREIVDNLLLVATLLTDISLSNQMPPRPVSVAAIIIQQRKFSVDEELLREKTAAEIFVRQQRALSAEPLLQRTSAEPTTFTALLTSLHEDVQALNLLCKMRNDASAASEDSAALVAQQAILKDKPSTSEASVKATTRKCRSRTKRRAPSVPDSVL